MEILNTPGLTAAQSVTDLAATADGSAVVIQNNGGDVVVRSYLELRQNS